MHSFKWVCLSAAVVAFVALTSPQITTGQSGIQQPAHVLGAYSTDDCLKANANGFVVSYGAACGAGGTAQVYSFGGGFVNGGSALTATTIALPVTAPAGCTIRAWSLSAPAADTGTATVKFLRVAAGTSSPAIGDSINTSGVQLSAGDHVRSTTLTDFTSTTVTQGDVIAVALTAVSGLTGLTASVECQ